MAFPVSLSIRCTKYLNPSRSLWSQYSVYSYLTPPGTGGSAKSADGEICHGRTKGQSVKCLRWTKSYQRFLEGKFSTQGGRKKKVETILNNITFPRTCGNTLCNPGLKRNLPQTTQIAVCIPVLMNFKYFKRGKGSIVHSKDAFGQLFDLNCQFNNIDYQLIWG